MQELRCIIANFCSFPLPPALVLQPVFSAVRLLSLIFRRQLIRTRPDRSDIQPLSPMYVGALGFILVASRSLMVGSPIATPPSCWTIRSLPSVHNVKSSEVQRSPTPHYANERAAVPQTVAPDTGRRVFSSSRRTSVDAEGSQRQLQSQPYRYEPDLSQNRYSAVLVFFSSYCVQVIKT